jgi:hypothetical protein
MGVTEKEYTQDELEELGLVECCGHCGSLHITIEVGLNNSKYCNTCSLVDYTTIMTLEDWAERDNNK